MRLMGLQLIHSDSGSIPNKRVVYSRNRITEPAWCLPSGSLATTEDELQGGSLDAACPDGGAFRVLPVPLVERILSDGFAADGRSVAARAQIGAVCKAWRAIAVHWSAELDAPARLTRTQRLWLETAPVPFRVIRICPDRTMPEELLSDELRDTAMVAVQKRSLPISTSSLVELHGLDLSSGYAAGMTMGISALDITRFTRLQTLCMNGFDPLRSCICGWRLNLPLSLRVLHVDGVEAATFEGRALAHLIALQELRLGFGANAAAMNLQLAGLPPSLQRLEILPGGEPLDPYPKLMIVPGAPLLAVRASAPAGAAPLASSDVGDGGRQPTSGPVAHWPASPASPAAAPLTVAVDFVLMTLPSPWPLPACCAVTLQTTLLNLMGEHAETAGTDNEQVTARLAAWVAGTGAASVKIRLSGSAQRTTFCVGTLKDSFNNLMITAWADLGLMADALVAQCSRLGLECRLEQGSDGPAVVIRRVPAVL